MSANLTYTLSNINGNPAGEVVTLLHGQRVILTGHCRDGEIGPDTEVLCDLIDQDTGEHVGKGMWFSIKCLPTVVRDDEPEQDPEER